MTGVRNGDGSPVDSLFGVALPRGTNAPGSQGVTASDTAGPVVGDPVISAPYGSSQLPANTPVMAVTAGDTSSFSDDQPAHASAIMPGPADAYMSSGAGEGTTMTNHVPRYPWQQEPGEA